MTSSDQPTTLAFVGGGRAVKRFLQLFENLEATAGASPFRVKAVADVDSRAPGLRYAARQGISVFSDFREFLGREDVDLVVELTGRTDILNALKQEMPDGVSLVDHIAARSIWDLLQLQELRLKQVRRDAHAQRMAVLSEMSTYFAHEIRNPLMSIGGFAQSLLTGDGLKNDEGRKRVQIIVDEAKRLEEVLKNVWDLTRPLVIQKDPADLNRVVEEVLEMLRPDMNDAGIIVETALDPDIKPSRFDAHWIKQCCLNIMKNACESMPGGGRLNLGTERIWNFMIFRCRDTGHGIPENLMDEIFNPFFTTKTGALGLGLAMAKKIIEDHGGEIAVASPPGQGTSVEFRLPLDRADE